jgi:hypothetical protein
VVVSPTAAERRGIQPVVTLTANGSERTEVAAGQTVAFIGTAEVPPGTGSIVAAQWDFDGTGAFAIASELRGSARSRQRVTVRNTYKFTKPGTYFPTLRVASQRQSDAQTPYARIQNLARVRVIVR